MQPHLPTSQKSDSLLQLLRDGAAQLGITLDETALVKLLRYQALLAEWGKKINLTALHDPRDVVVRHFLDSLALLRELPSIDYLTEHSLPATLVDIGSGAGFPGAICALLRPDLQVTLVERIGKKAAFLLTLRRELGLRYEVDETSAERLPGGFGIAVSRAALPLPGWLALGARLVVPGGLVFAMTTPREPGCEVPALTAQRDVSYEVGAGPHRVLSYIKNA